MEKNTPFENLLVAQAKIEKILSGSNGIVKGESIVDLSSVLVRISSEHELMQRDICTGLFRTPFDVTGKPGRTSERDAQQLWLTYFKDRIRLVERTDSGSKLKRLSGQDLDLIWNSIRLFSTYNSRRAMFDSIPKWDGVERIKTFMKDYFECDCNPNHFMLLMTAVIGKMDDPERNYVPYFFDIVGDARGTGKSSLLKRIFGEEYVAECHPSSRLDDFFVNIYGQNALVAMDDEMSWGSKNKLNSFSGDEFKNLVTQQYDTFSRKFCQPETHPRNFIIVRTSNNVRNSFAVVERRQIIFTVNLLENECRINDLDKDYFDQLKAEAKEYYVQHGVYKLTGAEIKDKERANLRNYNSDNTKNYAVVKWLNFVIKADDSVRDKYVLDIDKAYHRIPEQYRFVGWRGYEDWRMEYRQPEIDSRVFNRIMEWIAKTYPSMLDFDRTEFKLKGSTNRVKAARIKFGAEAEELDLPDMGF